MLFPPRFSPRFFCVVSASFVPFIECWEHPLKTRLRHLWYSFSLAIEPHTQNFPSCFPLIIIQVCFNPRFLIYFFNYFCGTEEVTLGGSWLPNGWTSVGGGGVNREPFGASSNWSSEGDQIPRLWRPTNPSQPTLCVCHLFFSVFEGIFFCFEDWECFNKSN